MSYKKVKGTILVPAIYFNNYVNDRFICLWNMLKDNLGFTIQTVEDSIISSDINVVIITTLPHYWSIESIRKLIDLKRSVKIIAFLQDPHTSRGFVAGHRFPKESGIGRETWDRFDIVLANCDEKFREWFPQYVSKSVWFPEFFGPYERYGDLKFNKNPKVQCLLIGTIGGKEPQVYPLRKFIRDNRDPKKVVYVESPGSFVKPSLVKDKRIYFGDRFAKLLHSYFCCVTDSASKEYNYVLGKRLEIPAAGSLLLADECNDSKKMGFVPHEHYIPVTKGSVFSQIDRCLGDPTKYTKIRKSGMEFVRKNHSINNRFKQLEEIIEGLL